MRDPGRTVIVLMLMSMQLWGALSASVDSAKVVRGDSVTLTIQADGDDVQPPGLNTICGETIISSSQASNIRSEQGAFRKSTLFSYVFAPLKDCTIGPMALTIDGKEEVTKAIDIRVIPMKITKNSPFILSMEADKRSVYVGEPFKVVVTFSQRHNSDAVDSKFLPPKLHDFWIKEEVKGRRFEEGEYSVNRLSYIIAAQKSGNFSLPPSQIKIATRSHSRDAWGQWLPALKWRTYFSNPVSIQVLPLPFGVDLVGDFTISVEADKDHLEANEAVNVKLTIQGSGNFEDIDSQKPVIENVTVYEEEGVTKAYIENGIYRGSWIQNFAFVADKNFIIPPFTLEYFDPVAQSIKSISTEPIAINVADRLARSDKSLKIQRPASAANSPEESTAQSTPAADWGIPVALGAVLGFLTGIVAMVLPWRRWIGQRQQAGSKFDPGDRRQLLMFLLPYRDDHEAARMITDLEFELYQGEASSINNKALKALLKRLRAIK